MVEGAAVGMALGKQLSPQDGPSGEDPHMLRHTVVTTMLDAGVILRDVQIAARHADPRTTMRYDGAARTSTATPTTSSPPTWHPEPNSAAGERLCRVECVPTRCAGGRTGLHQYHAATLLA
jgi:hypothetical protein